MHSEEIELRSERETEFMDITSEVGRIVRESGIKEGIANVFSRHTTTGIIINENEPNIVQDYQELLHNLVPRSLHYKHDQIDSNAASHLRAALLGPGVVVPVEGGRLSLGTWQRIFLVELDGPRRRKVKVQVMEG